MGAAETPAYRFGDLLALARQSRLGQIAAELGAAGYPDYRRSDALALRLLARGPMPVGRLGDALGVSRQAARKVADGLQRRGFVATDRDPADARHVRIALTDRGGAYAGAVATVLEHLDRDLARMVRPSDLVAADRVMRAVLVDEHTRALAAMIPPPGAAKGHGAGTGPPTPPAFPSRAVIG